MVVCNGEDLYGTGGVRSAKLSANNDRDRKENGFFGRSLILIVVLSARLCLLYKILEAMLILIFLFAVTSLRFFGACCFGRGDVGGGQSAGRNLPGI